ncbi:MAG TPA: peptide-methionine (R)-S-oxide reductase MsrB [Vicinamibacteria bacterium]|nr:peptide-methionine (R)-S-oxide reductase MsrB [Vicinamibacteria bacterium]
MTDEIDKPDAEWRRSLTPAQFEVLRRKGTERAFTGEFWDHHAQGTYHCAGCGLELFASLDKFDSGTGWPSFTCPVAGANVVQETDITHGMRRTEVLCRRCGGHLGHVFDDGPPPTGKRFCINSAALTFQKAGE